MDIPTTLIERRIEALLPESEVRQPYCAPVRCRVPLRQENTVASGQMAVVHIPVAPIERRGEARLPFFQPRVMVRLASKDSAIWKINAVSPWNLSAQSVVEPFAATPASAMLPAMVLAPVNPGLAVESEVRPMVARAFEKPALASRREGAPIARAGQSPAQPSLAVPLSVPRLPGAFAPRLFQADVVSAREASAVPAAAGEMPLAGALHVSAPLLERSLAPCLETCAGKAERRPEVAQPIAPTMPAFIPQAAAPRYAGELSACRPRLSTAIPERTDIGFARNPFAGIGPDPVERRLQPLVPQPTPVAGSPVILGEPVIPITGIGMPDPVGMLPLDVYVQRVRSSPRRECAWTNLDVRVAQPAAIPDLLPARFEQLVLQDWRRRNPVRQTASATAAGATGSKVLSIDRQLPALARLRRNAPLLVKGVAAAAVVCAFLWFSWSNQTEKGTVTADRHWLREAISRRATLVHDDNFRSGLDLWQGRKNWAGSWSHSADGGFMRTGQLALYRPTLKMENYRLEFFAQIESQSVGWVFRAKDEQNYYAMKLSVTEPGPRPLVSVVRYPVLAGHKGKRVQIPLPIMMHNNTPYHVALDVKGTRFRAFVEDQEVDSWSDDRLQHRWRGFLQRSRGARAALLG